MDDIDDDDVDFTALSGVEDEDTLKCKEEEARCWSRLKGLSRRERTLVEARRDDASL
jgi:hypothetical protein